MGHSWDIRKALDRKLGPTIADPSAIQGSSHFRGFQLEIAFASKDLRSICEDESCAQREYGPEVAEALKRRLADARAAASPSDLVAGQPSSVKKGTQEFIRVKLSHTHYLFFSVNHRHIPMQSDGTINWAKVSRIKIEQIGDDHAN